MRTIRRYIHTQLAGASIFALAALVGLMAFFDVVREVTDLGHGNYTFWRMLGYVLLLAPGHAYELMPLAVLIGVMVAMSLLATHSEYTVIRTSGVSLLQIGGVLVRFGLIFAVLTLLLGEFLAPATQKEANQFKLNATRSLVAQEFRSGAWFKSDHQFINVHEMLPDTSLRGIRIYGYDSENRLRETRAADSGRYLGDGAWELSDVRDTQLLNDRTVTHHYPTLTWKSVLQPSYFNFLLVEPEQMSANNLLSYIDHLAANRQKTQRYEIALWSKLFYPLACVSMSLVALAFTPRQRRHSRLGLQLFIGICIGISFYFINRLFGHLGLLYDWSPALSATLPTALFFAGGLWLIHRQEQR
jgi:lipopolysaccharide export system permease protein